MTSRVTIQDKSIGGKHEFDLACELVIWTVNILSKVAKVRVIPVSGNHAVAGDFHLSRVVKYTFGNKITFDDSHYTRKYYQRGSVGLQFTHGHNEKRNELMPLFIAESPDMYTSSVTKMAFKGHTHGFKETKTIVRSERVTENYGFIEKTLPSLNAREDYWHEKSGYRNNGNVAVAHVFNDKQQIAEFYAHI